MHLSLKCDQVMGRLRNLPIFSFLAKTVVILPAHSTYFSELPDNIRDYIIPLLPCPSIVLKLFCIVQIVFVGSKSFWSGLNQTFLDFTGEILYIICPEKSTLNLTKMVWTQPNLCFLTDFFLLLHYCGASEKKSHYRFCIKK